MPRHQLRALVDVEQAVRVGGGAVGVAGDVVQRVGPDVEGDKGDAAASAACWAGGVPYGAPPVPL